MEKILLKLYILPVPFQLTPARGRKPRIRARHTAQCRFQLTPARGRKLTACILSVGDVYFNSPPRGDENMVFPDRPGRSTFQLTPARGRKHLSSPSLIRTPRFQLTPARGRKPFYPRPKRLRKDFNSPPRGDEN